MKDVLLRSAILTTQLNLNYVRVGTIFAAFPPEGEQRDIAGFLDQRLAESGRVIRSLEQQIDALLLYRRSLIHECVTGQRRIGEADIAAARAAASLN